MAILHSCSSQSQWAHSVLPSGQVSQICGSGPEHSFELVQAVSAAEVEAVGSFAPLDVGVLLHAAKSTRLPTAAKKAFVFIEVGSFRVADGLRRWV
jgi:hypothetical protein